MNDVCIGLTFFTKLSNGEFTCMSMSDPLLNLVETSIQLGYSKATCSLFLDDLIVQPKNAKSTQGP